MPSRRAFIVGMGAALGVAAAGMTAPARAQRRRPRRGEITTLNVSTDLAAFGLPNMTPNTPGVDATRLLNAAIVLAGRYGLTTISADPGTYRFPLGRSGQYVVMSGVSGLTIDLQGSSLVFQGMPGTAIAKAAAIQATGCTDLTLRNFSVDYDPLPFSQYVVTNIQIVVVNGIASATVGLTPQAGFPGPEVFAAAPPGSLRGWPFRHGARLYTVGLVDVSPPAAHSPNTVTLTSPPFDPTAVTRLRVGDTLVIQLRDNTTESPALSFDTPVGCTVQNVDIYASGVQGIGARMAKACCFSGVRVIPPPGSSRLVSTNGGGIVLQQAGPDNQIVDCTFIGVQDDSVGVNSLALGVIAAVSFPDRSVTLADPSGLTGLDPAALARATAAVFVDDQTCAVSDPVTVKSIEGLKVTFAGPIPPGVQPNFLLCDPDPPHRGAGLVVSGNRVLQSCFARGMTFWGLSGVTIEGNYLDGTLLAGIDVLQKTTVDDWRCQPNDRVTVRGNVLANCNQSGSTDPEAAGAILVHSLTICHAPSTMPLNTMITVENNYVVNTPQAGLSLQNILGGSASDNVLQLTCLQPGSTTNPTCPPTLQPTSCRPVSVQYSTITLGPVISDSALEISVSPLAGVAPGTIASAQVLAAAGPPAGPLRFRLVDSSGTSFTPTVTGAWPSFQFVVPAAAALGVAALQISAAGTPVARGGTFIAAAS